MTSGVDRELQSIIQHPEYYIPGGDLFFQVDHVSFRVHKYFFERDSSYFAARLNTPCSPGAKPLGSSARAIVLDDVSPEQFSKLLWVFYNPLYSIYNAPAKTWEDILRMSSIWNFVNVKELAVRELERQIIPHINRIRLYLDNGVDQNLLIPCYAALCEREQPLTLEEGKILGMEVALQIAAGREQVRATITDGGVRSPLTPTVKGKDLDGLIRNLFKIEESQTNPGFPTFDAPVTSTNVQPAGGLKPTPAPQESTLPPPPPKGATSTLPVANPKPWVTKVPLVQEMEVVTPVKLAKEGPKSQGAPQPQPAIQTPEKTTTAPKAQGEKTKRRKREGVETPRAMTPAPEVSVTTAKDFSPSPPNDVAEPFANPSTDPDTVEPPISSVSLLDTNTPPPPSPVNKPPTESADSPPPPPPKSVAETPAIPPPTNPLLPSLMDTSETTGSIFDNLTSNTVTSPFSSTLSPSTNNVQDKDKAEGLANGGQKQEGNPSLDVFNGLKATLNAASVASPLRGVFDSPSWASWGSSS